MTSFLTDLEALRLCSCRDDRYTRLVSIWDQNYIPQKGDFFVMKRATLLLTLIVCTALCAITLVTQYDGIVLRLHCPNKVTLPPGSAIEAKAYLNEGDRVEIRAGLVDGDILRVTVHGPFEHKSYSTDNGRTLDKTLTALSSGECEVDLQNRVK